jgi:hypothetical protein
MPSPPAATAQLPSPMMPSRPSRTTSRAASVVPIMKPIEANAKAMPKWNGDRPYRFCSTNEAPEIHANSPA